jgi:thiamine-monophosphate kinase
MGATPRFYLLALALPPSRAGKWLDGMLAGMAKAARRLGMTLLGGDTSAQSSICLSLTVIGEIGEGLAVRRIGARAGDGLYVSGVLGQARLGLELLRRGAGQERRARLPLRRHFFPQPRVELGRWLAQHRLASAMIDLSDGLSSDLHRLCRAGGVGAHVDASRIPCTRLPLMPGLRLDALQLALHGGDDYELLFAVPRRLAHRIPARFRGLRLTRIGEITKPRAVLLQDEHGQSKPLRSAGWDPFRSK